MRFMQPVFAKFTCNLYELKNYKPEKTMINSSKTATFFAIFCGIFVNNAKCIHCKNCSKVKLRPLTNICFSGLFVCY